ncbi:phage tail length tape measure family protein [Azospirillum himalayense]|uniref:Phage tail length tape measure family protein n=1 Tax=Azospirillum himalayense TaxID=654847 RepID=A0ABW0GH23_9PROT
MTDMRLARLTVDNGSVAEDLRKIQGLFDAVGGSVENTTKRLTGTSREFQAIARQAGVVTDAGAKIVRVFGEAKAAIDKGSVSAEDGARAMSTLAKTVGITGQGLVEFVNTARASRATLEGLTEGTKEYREATAAHNRTLAEAIQKQQEKRRADEEAARKAQEATETTLRNARAVQALAEEMDSSTAAQNRFAAKQQEVIDLFVAGDLNGRQFARAMEHVSNSFDPAVIEARKLQVEYQNLLAKYDPVRAAVREHGQEVARATAILDKSNASEQVRAAVLKGIADAYDPATRAANERTAALKREEEAQAALMSSYREQAALARSNAEGQDTWNAYAGVTMPKPKSAKESADVFGPMLEKQVLADEWESLIALEGFAQKERVAQTKAAVASNWEAQLTMDAWGVAEAKARLAAEWQGMLAVEEIKATERVALTKAAVAERWEAQIAMEGFAAAEAKAKLAQEWEGMLAAEGFAQKERLAQLEHHAAQVMQAELDMASFDAPAKFNRLVASYDRESTDALKYANALGELRSSAAAAGVPLEQLAAAEEKLAAKMSPAALAAKRQADELAELRRAIDPMGERLRDLEAKKLKLDEAFAAGKLEGGRAEYEALSAAYEKHRLQLVRSTEAAEGFAGKIGLTRAQMTALAPQINDVVSGLMMGQPPMMIFVQQSGQIVQALQAGGAELPKFTAGTLALVSGYVALAAGFAATIYAVQSYRSEVKEVERVNALVGKSAGMTTAALLDQAKAVGDVAGISTSNAREIQNAYLGTGKIGGTVLADLTAATKGWSLATGQEVEAARGDLAALFADPSKAVDDLTAKYGMFDDAQRQLIKNYQAQGNLERAQAVLLQGIEDKAKAAAERMSSLGKAWEWIKKQAEDGVDWVGENGGQPSRQKQIEMLQLRQANGVYLTSGLRQADADELAALQQFEQDDAIQAWAAKVRAEFVRLSNATGDFARSIDPALAAANNMTNAEKLLDKAVSENVITRGEASRLMGLYREQVDSVTGSIAALSRQAANFNAPAGFERKFAAALDQATNGGKVPLTGDQANDLRANLADVAVGEVRDQTAQVQRQATAQRLLAGAISDTARAQAQARGQFAEVIAQYPDLDSKTAQASLTTKDFGTFLKGLPAPLQDLWKSMDASTAAQLAGSMNQATAEMRLQVDAAVRLAEAAGMGEAAQRRANIENQVAASRLKGLEAVTRTASEALEASTRLQIHNEFARGIDQEVAATARLVDAMSKGATATRDAEIYNAAYLQTLRETTPAEANWGEKLQANIDLLNRKAKASDSKAFADYGKQLEAQTRQLDLQQKMVGVSPQQAGRLQAEADISELLIRQGRTYESLTDAERKVIDAARERAVANADLEVTIQRQQDAYQTLANSLERAFDRVGDALVDVFIRGEGKAVNFGSVARGILASLLSDMIKMSLVNPLANAAFGTNRGTLFDLAGSPANQSGSMGMGDMLSLGKIGDSWSSSMAGIDAWTARNLPGVFSIDVPLNTGQVAQQAAQIGTGARELASNAMPSAGAGGSGALPFSASQALQGLGVAANAFGAFSSFRNGQVASGVGSVVGAGAGIASLLGVGGALMGPLAIAAPLVGTLVQSFIKEKPSNREGNVSIDFGTGATTVGGQEGKKFSAENRQAAQGIGSQIQQLAATLEALLPGQQIKGRGLIAVGDRDGLRAEYSGEKAEFGKEDTAGLVNWFTKQFAEDMRDGFERGDLTEQVASNLQLVLDKGITGSVEQFIADLQLAATDFAKVFDMLGKAQPDQTATAIQAAAQSFTSTRDAAEKLGLSVTGLADSFRAGADRILDAGIRAAQGFDGVDRAMSINATFEANAVALLAAGQDPAKAIKLYGAQMSALVNSLDVRQLEEMAKTLKGVDDVAVAFADERRRQLIQANRDTFEGDAASRLQAARLAMGQISQDQYDWLTLETKQAAELADVTDGVLRSRMLEVQAVERQVLAYQQSTAAAEKAAAAAAAKAAEDEKAAAVQASAAQKVAGTIQSLTSYASGLAFSDLSALAPEQQYSLATSQFNAVSGAAVAGDYNSLSQLQSYSDAYLRTARQQFGSGQGYADAFAKVTDVLSRVATVEPDRLTSSAMAMETRTQTATLVDELRSLKAEVSALRAQVAADGMKPARVA